MARELRDTWLGSVGVWATLAVGFFVLGVFNAAARNWLGPASNVGLLFVATCNLVSAVQRRRERERGSAG